MQILYMVNKVTFLGFKGAIVLMDTSMFQLIHRIQNARRW